jgi:hypothetical protein
MDAPFGILDLRLARHGRVERHVRLRNLVVVTSKYIHARLLGGATAGNSITQVGFGSTATPAALGNTALSVDAYIKAVDGITYPAANQVAFAISLGTFEANGIVLAEFGLLTANGGLYARLVRAAPLVKDASMSLTATWTLTF